MKGHAMFKKKKFSRLPNLIIIGASKCATTSLHWYLGFHPEIFMSLTKELDFFIRERNWHKGVEWYKSNFIGKAKVYGESSPGYTAYPLLQGVPERMHALVPEAKLIYILRDPIDRIISEYRHRHTDRVETRQISEALKDLDSNPYIIRSKYYQQLEQYLNFFPGSNILIITQEDLYNHRRQTLQRVFVFLEVDDSFYSKRFSCIKNESVQRRKKNGFGLFLERMACPGVIKLLHPKVRWLLGRIYYPFSQKIERPKINEGLQREIAEYLRDDINRLRKYTGHNFEGWCV